MPNLDFYDDNITVEWINGVKYMSPSPHPNHGMVYKKLFVKIANYLEEKPYELFPDKTIRTIYSVPVTFKASLFIILGLILMPSL